MTGTPEGDAQKPDEGRQPQRIRRPVIIRVYRGFVRQINRSRGRQKPPQNLHQINERMMAVWTSRVGWFTGALVLVSIVTAFIFKGQLNVMQGQLDEMKLTRDAIIESDGADIFVDSVFLVPEGWPIQGDPTRDQKGLVHISYLNGAKMVGHIKHAFLVFAADVPPLPIEPNYPTRDETSAHTDVPAGSTSVLARIDTTDFSLRPKDIFDAELTRITRRVDILYVYGRFEYSDRFRTRKGCFCRKYDPDAMVNPRDPNGVLLVACGLPAFEGCHDEKE
jgi:hypothetical protein